MGREEVGARAHPKKKKECGGIWFRGFIILASQSKKTYMIGVEFIVTEGLRFDIFLEVLCGTRDGFVCWLLRH